MIPESILRRLTRRAAAGPAPGAAAGPIGMAPGALPAGPGTAGAPAATGTTAGLFTPDGLALGARVIRAGDGVISVLAVTGYPAMAYPGWLAPLLNHPGRLDVSMHIGPVDPITAAERLKRRRARLVADLDHDARTGRIPDPLWEAADDGAAELAARIARAEARLYTVGIYLAVHATDIEALADEVEAVRRLAASLMLDVRPVSYRQLDGWQACLPFALEQVRVHRVMDTDPIAAAFPFASDELPGPDPTSDAAPDGVFHGFALDTNGLIFHDEFTAENYNTVILGPSGFGKSYLNKATLLRSLYRDVAGHRIQAIAVDPEDEYTQLTHAVGGAVVRVGAPGVRINPFDLGHAQPDALRRRALFLHTFVAVLLDREIDPSTRAVLDEAITHTYSRAGITADPATWGRPASILADLAATLADHPDPAGPELATQLGPYTVGAWSGLFNGPTTTEPAGQLVSWSLRELPDELRGPATLVVLDHIWRQLDNPTQRRPRIVVIDEAWRFLTQPIAQQFIAAMVRSNRKRWGALRFITQHVGDALASELGAAILTNAATTILTRQQPQTIDELARVYALTAGEQAFLLRAGVGEALLITATRRVAVRIVASPVEDSLITTDPAQLAEYGSGAEHHTPAGPPDHPWSP
ncbi:hypothetical protein GCM10023321_72670 [Pseudonocardia eucalypti]|uniref:TraG P-loop domain-containing protein n=1 Tax=Pseudonocardia eucalypti TaxID=648755 RepID=A0ABP9R781_9PSEU|nr:hypothetical protein [Pseudonocardia eucalypti]